jgi:hypothetical protein
VIVLLARDAWPEGVRSIDVQSEMMRLHLRHLVEDDVGGLRGYAAVVILAGHLDVAVHAPVGGPATRERHKRENQHPNIASQCCACTTSVFFTDQLFFTIQ